MGIFEVVSTISVDDKFVIPCAGKMVWSTVSKTDKALCFVLNKGFVETDTLEDMLDIIDYIRKHSDTLLIVGNIDKVKLRNSEKIVYRQRVFYNDLKELILMCASYGMKIEVPDTFRISIDNITRCVDILPYIEKYASFFNETIENWLTKTCLIHLKNLLMLYDVLFAYNLSLNIDGERAEGYMNRAPFLMSSFDTRLKKSSVFIEPMSVFDNKKYYESEIINRNDLELINGFTLNNIANDKKEGFIDAD